MELAGAPRPDSRADALGVLVSDVNEDPAGRELAFVLIELLLGDTHELPVIDEPTQDRFSSFATRHRVRSISNRVLPGAGGHALEALASSLGQQSRLIEVVQLLEEHGHDVLVLKGNATGPLDYANPTDRESGDIDLLVRPPSVRGAIEVLGEAGFVRIATHPFRTSGFFHSETLRHDDGTEIDLHTRLHQVSRTPRSCWQRPDAFVIGGQRCQAMDTDWRFLHALVHQVMNPPPSFRGLNGLLDVVLLVSRADLKRVGQLADEIGLRCVVAKGLADLSRLLERPLSMPGHSDPSRIEARYAEAVSGNRRVPGYLSLLGGLSVQPKSAWISYLRQLLWPTAEYRADVGRSGFGQIVHVAREAIGR